MAAVVDRIPYPTSARPTNWTDNQPSAEKAPTGTHIEDGSEGMSFAVLDSKSAAPELWSAWAELNQLETVPLQQRCTLSFAFPRTAIPVPVFPYGRERTQPLVSRVLQLPVANTLFKTGEISTLIAQRWKSRGSTESSCALSCIQKARLPQQTLRLTELFSDQSTGLNQSLHSHLMPITPTRTITAAIGNIIRRISLDDTSDEGVPASEELEQAISEAIKHGRIPSEQAGIWALVRPPNCPFPGQSGGNIGGTVSHEIQQAVLTGCQLHKVLSGGGGWGEKQGLLALDPDSDYHISQQAFEPPYWEDQGVEPKSMQAFGHLVNPGDTVKFFVYRSPQTIESTSEATPKFDSAANLKSLSLKFGSLSSNMDAMPNIPINETTSSSQPSCMVIKHHFGMLSEQGMSLESTFVETDLRASMVPYLVPRLLEQGLLPFKVLDELVLTTKLDAPYTTWSIDEDVQAGDPTSEVNWSRPQSLGEDAHNGTPQKRTATGNDITSGTMMRPDEGKSETLDDFIEAMGTMPSHQHVATISPHPRDRRRTKGKAGGDTYSKALATSQKVAKPRGRPVRQLIRKFEKGGLEVGAASVSLTQFSQVQSHIHNWAKRSGERKDAIEQLQRHDTNAYQSDKMDKAHFSQQPPDDITSAKSEEMGGRGEWRPKGQVNRDLRIRRHVAKLPSVMTQQLPSSVRNKIILEPSLLEEDHMVTEEQLETPMSESSTDPATTEQRTRHSALVRKLTSMVVRTHKSFTEATGIDSLRRTDSLGRKRKSRRYQLRNMQVRKHLSHEAPPTDARDKAKKLHKEYQLPLLDERPDDAPRP